MIRKLFLQQRLKLGDVLWFKQLVNLKSTLAELTTVLVNDSLIVIVSL